LREEKNNTKGRRDEFFFVVQKRPTSKISVGDEKSLAAHM
jgi:hypothetical protein